jgi:hypothetical protein
MAEIRSPGNIVGDGIQSPQLDQNTTSAGKIRIRVLPIITQELFDQPDHEDTGRRNMKKAGSVIMKPVNSFNQRDSSVQYQSEAGSVMHRDPSSLQLSQLNQSLLTKHLSTH